MDSGVDLLLRYNLEIGDRQKLRRPIVYQSSKCTNKPYFNGGKGQFTDHLSYQSKYFNAKTSTYVHMYVR